MHNGIEECHIGARLETHDVRCVARQRLAARIENDQVRALTHGVFNEGGGDGVIG